MPRKETLDHLARLYAANDDPWDHRTSSYEADKYAATLAAIGPGPFTQALEIGCGNGTLARRLADHCDSLTVMDCIPATVLSARRALALSPHVTVLQGSASHDLPDLCPDLVLLSEVLYFLTADEITALGHWLLSNVTGSVIAVNWTGPTDEELNGMQALSILHTVLGRSEPILHTGYRIDLFSIGAASAEEAYPT